MRPVSLRKLGLSKECTDEEYSKALSIFQRKQKKEKLEKQKEKRKIKREKNRDSIPYLVREADKYWSLFIRERDNYKCVICGSEKNPQCGHLIKRGKKTVRWDELNTNCICSSCNYRDNQEPQHYHQWFLRNYTVNQYEFIVEQSKLMWQPDRVVLRSIIEISKKAVLGLKRRCDACKTQRVSLYYASESETNGVCPVCFKNGMNKK